jgi:hypothetical protein
LLQASTSAFFDVGYSTCLFACSKTPFKTLMDYSLISNTTLCLISLLTLQIAKLHCSNLLIVKRKVTSSCFARVQVARPAYRTQEPIKSKSPINRRNEHESRRRVPWCAHTQKKDNDGRKKGKRTKLSYLSDSLTSSTV